MDDHFQPWLFYDSMFAYWATLYTPREPTMCCSPGSLPAAHRATDPGRELPPCCAHGHFLPARRPHEGNARPQHRNLGLGEVPVHSHTARFGCLSLDLILFLQRLLHSISCCSSSAAPIPSHSSTAPYSLAPSRPTAPPEPGPPLESPPCHPPSRPTLSISFQHFSTIFLSTAPG